MSARTATQQMTLDHMQACPLYEDGCEQCARGYYLGTGPQAYAFDAMQPYEVANFHLDIVAGVIDGRGHDWTCEGHPLGGWTQGHLARGVIAALEHLLATPESPALGQMRLPL